MAVVGAVGLASGLVQTLLTALQTQEVKEMCSMFSCGSQLEKLKNTMKSINALLLDVDSKSQSLSHQCRDWVEKLKDAVYDIDDLLDEFATIGQQRKQLQDAKFYKKVGNFFSSNNKFFVDFNMSGEIKMLREKLDDITKDHQDFGLKVIVDKPVVPRPETCSTISELEIIGREDDLETIVGMLLSDEASSGQNFCFVSIVGVGGLGKTTLAQLVYNDERVEGAFSKRIWVCVSEQFGPKEICSQILGKEVFNLQVAQEEVRTLLRGKKFLLVLDDVWNEDHEEWRNLKPFLVSDVSGSKIIVTTRSKKVATSIGEDLDPYELDGLSEGNSWNLFKRIAFGSEKENQVDPDLVKIGNDIVKKCVNVPLSIRVVASLLYNQGKDKWELFRSINLADMSHEGKENSIMQTLMFSYYQLTPELKSCFSFCSIFPKDHIIQKELLISLWMAQGYLVPTGNHQSMEDVGESYFMILLNRCFFQDINLYRHGDVYSFKMHDLMHDLALKVAGKESLFISKDSENHLGEKIRHLCMHRHIPDLCLSNTVRTYLCLHGWCDLPTSSTDSLPDEVTPIISKCKRLRVLSLSDFAISRNLPKRLGKLLHLRFLDLSKNGFELLPKSITNLHNLQILKLRECTKLKELPEEMSKLVDLKVLDIYRCNGLTYMPRGMNNLKKLHTLTQFVVGGIDSKQTQGSKLGDLQALRSLKGDLCIRLLDFSSCNMPHAGSRAFILRDAHLKNLDIRCGRYCLVVGKPIVQKFGKNNFDQSEVHERLVEDLCPNDDISGIFVSGYEGTKLPSWLLHVTSISRFWHLKVIELFDLANVEYVDIASRGWESQTFFPVLEKLELINMPKLKGWWRGLRWREMEGGGGCLVDANGDIHTEHAVSLPYFPRLHDLIIEHCESMTYFPPCPHVKQLKLWAVNEALTFCMKGGASSSNVSASLRLEIDSARLMNTVVTEFVAGAVSVKLIWESEMKSMRIVKEGFERLRWGLKSLSVEYCMELDMEDEEEDGMPWRCLQSLSSLELFHLPKMVKLPKGLQYLTSLQSLLIHHCYNLEELGECIGFLTSLQSLRVFSCQRLKALPECIGFLSSLQYLGIAYSKGIVSLPESIRHLTSLTTIDIYGICNELRERCRQPDGEDWPKICHIPNLRFFLEHHKINHRNIFHMDVYLISLN